MSYAVFSPMADLMTNESCVIKLLEYGQPETGQYGEYYPNCLVEVDGLTQVMNLSGKKKQELDEKGVQSGDLIQVERFETRAYGKTLSGYTLNKIYS